MLWNQRHDIWKKHCAWNYFSVFITLRCKLNRQYVQRKRKKIGAESVQWCRNWSGSQEETIAPQHHSSADWCFRTVSSRGDILALLQQSRKKVKKQCVVLFFYHFVCSSPPLPCLYAITQPDALLNNSRHLVRQLRQSRRTSRA